MALIFSGCGSPQDNTEVSSTVNNPQSSQQSYETSSLRLFVMPHILKGATNDKIEGWVSSLLKPRERIVLEVKCDGPFYTSAGFLLVIIYGVAIIAIAIFTSCINDIPQILYWSRTWPTLLMGFFGLAIIYFAAESVKQSLYVTNSRIFVVKQYSWLRFSLGEIIELDEIKHIKTTLLRNGLQITKSGFLGKRFVAFRLPNARALREEILAVLKLPSKS